jgi:hypothetical protein
MQPYLPFLMVSTTCVEGFLIAVETDVKRPFPALRPILAIRITSFLNANALCQGLRIANRH